LPSCLSKKAELEDVSREVLELLQPHFMCDYDVTQSIGRRYRRRTRSHALLRDGRLRHTQRPRGDRARDRDTTEQVRVAIPELLASLRDERDSPDVTTTGGPALRHRRRAVRPLSPAPPREVEAIFGDLRGSACSKSARARAVDETVARIGHGHGRGTDDDMRTVLVRRSPERTP